MVSLRRQLLLLLSCPTLAATATPVLTVAVAACGDDKSYRQSNWLPLQQPRTPSSSLKSVLKSDDTVSHNSDLSSGRMPLLAVTGASSTVFLKSAAMSFLEARDQARSSGPGHVTVLLAPGLHDVGGEGLLLEARDSSTTWRSADPNAPAVISAALGVTGWTSHPHQAAVVVAPVPPSVPDGVPLRRTCGLTERVRCAHAIT